MTLDAKKDHHENGQRLPFTGNGFTAADLTPLAHANLESVCHSVMELARAAPRPPLKIKLQHGHMTVEMEWPDPTLAAPAVPLDGAGPEAGLVQPAGGPAAAPHSAAGAAAAAAAAGAAQIPVVDEVLTYLLAPTVGTFYHAPEPGAPPFVSVGDTVRPGQPIGILEVMKMMSTIEAEAAGRVVELLVQDGCPVEFQQRLVSLEPLSEAEA
ncbi:acetyl-CoA carboxylase biotin carboxyl carrier protein [Streptomyces sp. NPDC048639]|uniref:acetyl-CoA carboxylase biotin carboxyl carrier protein n=1 Tax=Streptomyces sp. NPDC048639 TaxID=3365581 RepID=UPI0037216F31